MSRAVTPNWRPRGSGLARRLRLPAGRGRRWWRSPRVCCCRFLRGGPVMIFAAFFGGMGIKRFYDQPISWRATALITGLSLAGLTFFIVAYDSASARIFIYSLGQAFPFVPTLKLLLAGQDGHRNPGARLAGIVAVLII